MNGHLEGKQPYLGDLRSPIVINHLLIQMRTLWNDISRQARGPESLGAPLMSSAEDLNKQAPNRALPLGTPLKRLGISFGGGVPLTPQWPRKI